MLNKEYEILKPFIDKPWARLTFKEVKTLTRKKSESYVYNSLKRFLIREILKEEHAGNVILYSLNVEASKSRAYAGFTAEFITWNKKNLPFRDLERIMGMIPTSFHISMITGSYASNKQKKDSDLDMAVIVDDTLDAKEIYGELKHACEMNIPLIHLYVFRKSDFLSMLLDQKANYGKEIAKNQLILSGGEEYFDIIREAIKNGFNG